MDIEIHRHHFLLQLCPFQVDSTDRLIRTSGASCRRVPSPRDTWKSSIHICSNLVERGRKKRHRDVSRTHQSLADTTMHFFRKCLNSVCPRKPDPEHHLLAEAKQSCSKGVHVGLNDTSRCIQANGIITSASATAEFRLKSIDKSKQSAGEVDCLAPAFLNGRETHTFENRERFYAQVRQKDTLGGWVGRQMLSVGIPSTYPVTVSPKYSNWSIVNLFIPLTATSFAT